MKKETKRVIVGGIMVGAVFIPMFSGENHEHIVESDYTQGNMMQTISAYGATGNVSASVVSMANYKNIS